jgi:hypothetical protein
MTSEEGEAEEAEEEEEGSLTGVKEGRNVIELEEFGGETPFGGDRAANESRERREEEEVVVEEAEEEEEEGRGRIT